MHTALHMPKNICRTSILELLTEALFIYRQQFGSFWDYTPHKKVSGKESEKTFRCYACNEDDRKAPENLIIKPNTTSPTQNTSKNCIERPKTVNACFTCGQEGHKSTQCLTHSGNQSKPKIIGSVDVKWLGHEHIGPSMERPFLCCLFQDA